MGGLLKYLQLKMFRTQVGVRGFKNKENLKELGGFSYF